MEEKKREWKKKVRIYQAEGILLEANTYVSDSQVAAAWSTTCAFKLLLHASFASDLAYIDLSPSKLKPYLHCQHQ